MDKETAERCFWVKCMYCGEEISGNFDDTSVERIAPLEHNCKGVYIK